MYNSKDLEDETHCLIVISIVMCENIYMRRIHCKYQYFEMYLDTENINTVIYVKYTAEYLYKAYYKRHSLMYY